MALTKVSGGILDPGINVAGVVTAIGFDGPFIGGSEGINAGVGTFTGLDVNGNGDISGNLVIGGNLTANGDFTTLNTTLREVEILRVDANTTATAGIITQRGSGNILDLYDTSTQVLSVKDGGNVERRGKEIKKDDLKQLQAKDDVDLIFDIESGISDRIVRDFYKERKPGQSITDWLDTKPREYFLNIPLELADGGKVIFLSDYLKQKEKPRIKKLDLDSVAPGKAL